MSAQNNNVQTKTSSSNVRGAFQKRRRGRGGYNNASNSKYVTRHELKGGRIIVRSTNPPSIATIPWNPLTLLLGGSNLKGKGEVTVGDLVQTLKDQLGKDNFAATNKDKEEGCLMELRLKSVHAWNLTGKTIAMSVYDLSANNAEGSKDILGGWMDAGGPDSLANIRYDYGNSQSSIVLPDATDIDTKKVVINLALPSNDNCLVYYYILWRFYAPYKLPTFNDIMIQHVRSIDNTTRNIKPKITQAVKELTSIREHQASLLSRIIDGAENAAMAVVPVVGEEILNRVDSIINELSRINLSDFQEL